MKPQKSSQKDTCQQPQQVQASKQLYQQACNLLPGGVNSPVRAFGAVGGVPRFMKKAKGCRVIDQDDNEYIDYLASWGPMILGHCHESVSVAVARAAQRGLSFGTPTKLEVRMAELVCAAFDSIEMVRFVNSGTEATTSAIRLARGITGRDKILKVAGGYHGHVDALLVQAGSGLITFGLPSSAGVPKSVTADTVVIPYNDPEAAKAAFSQCGEQLACLLIEPIAGNMGVVQPQSGYLQTLRQLCDKHSVLLIFDEVITGFRVAMGGAQQLYGVSADLTCLGKIIGGGLPVGAYGGSRKLMEHLAPLGPVYQAGTLSGNPLATTAGIATVEALTEPGLYDRLEELSASLAQGLKSAAAQAGVQITINRVGSMMTVFFNADPVMNYQDAMRSDTAAYAKFFHAMLQRGVYIPPAQFEAMFVSAAHQQDDIDQTIATAEIAFTIDL